MDMKSMLSTLRESRIDFDENLYVRARYGNGKYYGPSVSIRWIIEEQEPEFDTLDQTLALIAPHITYLHYREICRELIERATYDDSDYYSTTEHGIKYLELEKLHRFLTSKGYLK